VGHRLAQGVDRELCLGVGFDVGVDSADGGEKELFDERVFQGPVMAASLR